jgi:hypothetical protein
MLDPPGRFPTGCIGVVAIIVTLFILAMAFHDIFIKPCRATGSWRKVTSNLGTYERAYIDNSEWCLWVRGAF